MTRAQVMAVLAAAAGVAGAWDALAAVERVRAWAWLHAAMRPLARSAADGVPATRAERRRLAAVASAALLAAGWLLAGPFAAAGSAAAGPAVVASVLAGRRRAHRARLADGAAPAARALAAAFGAGRPVHGAIAVAAHALDGPAGRELRRVEAALAAGRPTEAALESLRARAGSRPWDTLVAAVLLQRDAGGNLPALLRDLARSLEAADRAERDARAVTAQARFTAGLVAGLPLVAVAIAELAAPGFVRDLLAEPLPAVLVGLAAVLQLIALAAVRGITRRLGAP